MRPKLKLKPCPYCGGKMFIQEDENNAFGDNCVSDIRISLRPVCTECQTRYPDVTLDSVRDEVIDLMWNKIREQWEEI